MLAGLGLALGSLAFGLPRSAAAATATTATTAAKAVTGFAANVFVHVAPDGLVSIVCARSEMGQGVRSSLPALIADELGADMARVTIIQADGDKKYGDQNTDGSSSVRKDYTTLRKLGATARTLLVTAAAQKWRVPAKECVAEHHAVTHAKTRRSLGFGELALLAAKLPPPKPADVVLRPKAELLARGARAAAIRLWDAHRTS